MTVSSTTNRVSYAGNGTANPLAVSFPFLAQSDLVVVATIVATGAQSTLVLNSDYTISGTPDVNGYYTSGGSVVPASAISSGTNWTIYRDPALTQLVQHVDEDPLPAESIDTPVDRLTMIAQRTRELALRSLRVADGDAPPQPVIPTTVLRATKALGFDSSGNPAVSQSTLAQIDAVVTANNPANVTNILAFGKFKGVNNIFDQINDPVVIAAIQTGSPTIYLDTYVAAAIAQGGTWFFPAGSYHFNAKIVMAPGVEFWGAGVNQTVFYLGGDGTWGMEMLNANGINQVEAFKLKDIQFQLTNGGIRWNSLTGGFTDDNTSQAYMMRPRIERCMVLNDSASHFTGVQFSKCFNGVIRDNFFRSNSISIQLMGSDINDISNNRSDSATDCAVQVESSGTFGSFNRVAHNDLNNPKNCFYRGSDRAGYFGFNHCELDFSPGSSGTAGNMPAMIDLLGTGNPFTTIIENNGIEGDQFTDHWLRFRGQTTVYSLTVTNNRGADTFHSTVDIGEFPYFTNAGDRTMCVHCGNGGTDVFFPMNTQGDSVDDAANVYFVFNASRPGISYAASTIKPNCADGDVVLHPDTNVAHFIEISDWTGQPNNQMIGHFNIAAVLYADVTGQQMRYDVLDNGVSLIGGWQTYTASAGNKKELVTLAAAVTAATKLQIRVQNIDNTRNTRGYIHQVVGGFA